MELTLQTFLIVCPLVFLAGLIDAIGGGGGLISLPAYLLAGLPPHYAVATNKLSSPGGTALATIRFLKNGLINLRLAVPAVIAAFLGSSLGSRISLMVPDKVITMTLFVILPVVSFLVMNRKLFRDNPEKELVLNRRLYLTATISAFVVGIYDGFYGPGTGTFLIIAFTVFAKLDVKTANAQAKIINLTTNLSALAVFLASGKVIIPLGLAAMACNMLGGYIGSGMVLKNGSKIVKPCIILVLVLLLIKIITEL